MTQTKDNKTKNIYLLLSKAECESDFDTIVGAFSKRNYAIEYRREMKREGEKKLPRIVKMLVDLKTDEGLSTLYVLRRRECANVLDLPWNLIGLYSSMSDLENARAVFKDKDERAMANRDEYSEAYLEEIQYDIEEIALMK